MQYRPRSGATPPRTPSPTGGGQSRPRPDPRSGPNQNTAGRQFPRNRSAPAAPRQADAPAPPNAAGSGEGNRMPPRVENLDVFNLAHELALKVYAITRQFPADERGGLTPLTRRAATAVASNLAAGFVRSDRTEYRQLVGVANGSAAETRYALLLAKDLGYLPAADYDVLRDGYERVGKMLHRLGQALATPRPSAAPAQ